MTFCRLRWARNETLWRKQEIHREFW